MFYFRPPEDFPFAAAGLISSHKGSHHHTIQRLSELPHAAFGALARQADTTIEQRRMRHLEFSMAIEG